MQNTATLKHGDSKHMSPSRGRLAGNERRGESQFVRFSPIAAASMFYGERVNLTSEFGMTIAEIGNCVSCTELRQSFPYEGFGSPTEFISFRDLPSAPESAGFDITHSGV